tara:strand:- start:617 stop:1492 length:876 start_codon:yes stop_codon:yes gene_type:complete
MDFEIYEVTPRDGLQGLDTIVPTSDKIILIDLLVQAGFKKIEVGSFVHPLFVPNMADSDIVLEKASEKHTKCDLSVLIPNKRGMERARERGVKKYNIFMSPSRGFTMNNHNDTKSNVYHTYAEIMAGVPRKDIRVYLSCVFGCPVDGEISDSNLIKSMKQAETLGDTIVLSDTTGQATSEDIASVMDLAKRHQITSDFALHLHHGMNNNSMSDKLDMAYDLGIREFDSCIQGLGGCPFVLGSNGNLATEDLVSWGEKRGLRTSTSREKLCNVIDFVSTSISKGQEALSYTT